MEVTIAVQNVAAQVSLETDQTPEEVAAAVESALAGGVLRLTDVKGRQLLVPGATIGWVQIGEGERGRVGFGLS